jgi:hypothetical protein
MGVAVVAIFGWQHCDPEQAALVGAFRDQDRPRW